MNTVELQARVYSARRYRAQLRRWRRRSGDIRLLAICAFAFVVVLGLAQGWALQ